MQAFTSRFQEAAGYAAWCAGCSAWHEALRADACVRRCPYLAALGDAAHPAGAAARSTVGLIMVRLNSGNGSQRRTYVKAAQ
jgi:hypothetical protein